MYSTRSFDKNNDFLSNYCDLLLSRDNHLANNMKLENALYIYYYYIVSAVIIVI